MLAALHALVLASATAIAPLPPDSTELRREALMSALQRGGYTIVLRHARTDRSFQEEIAYVPADRSKQRNLSEDGVADARLMGVVLKKYAIPIGEIVSSPMYRTRETAEAAAGTPATTMALRTFPALPEAGQILAAAPKPGTNRLVVTHHFIIETFVPGVTPGAIGESEAAVVRPAGDGKVLLVGRITLDDWRSLAGLAPASTSLPPAAAPAPQIVHHGGETYLPASAIQHDAPVVRLARAYLEAFNSGDASRMRVFLEESMVANPERSIDQRLELYTRLFEEHGPLVLNGLLGAADREVTLGMASKRGPLTLVVKESAQSPGRLASVSFAFERGGHS